MAGVRKLAKIQLGDENTAGTATAATAIWRGPAGFFEDEEVPEFVEEDVGRFSGSDRTFIPKAGAVIEFPETEATFEQLPYVLMAGVESTSPSAATNSTGTAQTWTFEFATSSAQTTKTYTIEAGDNQQAEEAAYMFVEEFTITGAVDEALKMSATWRGRQVSTTSFTGSLSLAAVEEILFNKGVLYIDDSGGSIGSTQKSSTLVDMGFTAKTGLIAYQTAEGNIYFTATKQVGPEIELSITFEHEATAVAEKAKCKAQTGRLIRLKWEGTNCTDEATAKSLTIDMAGKWASFDVIDESDGNSICTGTFNVREVTADSLYCEVAIVNDLASLP